MLASLNAMIRDFKRLNISVDRTEQTFMQLTGYPQLENVCSNVQAFFLDTGETHGFKGLFIKSLLECIGTDTRCRSTENIKREMRTNNGNRIDIFIETDKHLIAIENKVFSGVNNPLADYEAHIKSLNLDSVKESVFILLSLKEESVGGSAFINVTYSKLFSAVRQNLGKYVINANTKWIVILNDFIKTTEDFKGDVTVDKEFIEFLKENEKAIDALLEAKERLAKSFQKKIRNIIGILSIDEKLKYQPEIVDNNYAEWYMPIEKIGKTDLTANLGLYLDTKSYIIAIGIDNAMDSQREQLEQVLSDKQIRYTRWEEYWEKYGYYRLLKPDIFESEEFIAKEFQIMLGKLINESAKNYSGGGKGKSKRFSNPTEKVSSAIDEASSAGDEILDVLDEDFRDVIIED